MNKERAGSVLLSATSNKKNSISKPGQLSTIDKTTINQSPLKKKNPLKTKPVGSQ
jgi:hypothetical protein